MPTYHTFEERYKWRITHKENKSLPSRGHQDSKPLFITYETSTTPTIMFSVNNIVGMISKVVHFKANMSEFSLSYAFDVTMKYVFTPPKTLNIRENTARKCVETPPITQNCSFLHSLTVTPLHLISNTIVLKMQKKRDINHMPTALLCCNANKNIDNKHTYWYYLQYSSKKLETKPPFPISCPSLFPLNYSVRWAKKLTTSGVILF